MTNTIASSAPNSSRQSVRGRSPAGAATNQSCRPNRGTWGTLTTQTLTPTKQLGADRTAAPNMQTATAAADHASHTRTKVLSFNIWQRATLTPDRATAGESGLQSANRPESAPKAATTA
jgi:hypothetical protein